MKLIFASILVLALISCKDKKEKIGDLNDIMPKSEKYNGNETIDSTSVEAIKLSDVFLDEKELTKSKLNLVNLRWSDTLLFPDRFQSIKKTTFLYSMDKDSVLWSKWNFRDSVKTKNTFLNWTNCFGAKCNAIRIGQKANLQKDGFLLMTNDTCLIYVGTNSKQEQEKWLDYFTQDKKQKWNYILTQSRNGKVAWQYFKDKKLDPIEETQIEF